MTTQETTNTTLGEFTVMAANTGYWMTFSVIAESEEEANELVRTRKADEMLECSIEEYEMLRAVDSSLPSIDEIKAEGDEWPDDELIREALDDAGQLYTVLESRTEREGPAPEGAEKGAEFQNSGGNG